MSDPYYYDHQIGAQAAMAMGTDIGYIADLWNFDLVGGVPSDAIVPVARQSVSGQEVVNASDFSHLQETGSGRQVVRNWLNILQSR